MLNIFGERESKPVSLFVASVLAALAFTPDKLVASIPKDRKLPTNTIEQKDAKAEVVNKKLADIGEKLAKEFDYDFDLRFGKMNGREVVLFYQKGFHNNMDGTPDVRYMYFLDGKIINSDNIETLDPFELARFLKGIEFRELERKGGPVAYAIKNDYVVANEFSMANLYLQNLSLDESGILSVLDKNDKSVINAVRLLPQKIGTQEATQINVCFSINKESVVVIYNVPANVWGLKVNRIFTREITVDINNQFVFGDMLAANELLSHCNFTK